ncbi:uncharacterized protein NFIA_022380 [Aspergillus fischeri NRRL 181]|uniref:Myb-like DNA-binding domain-containing protein n=1 Tax=Neosartorya fischeri (strain ATCC 1020 / DSM 3700 / CBS 544.65 / FGSC A1164 / JCM 1740 / NRRL 181 / WB 181) TaxID=331117 RepID=A1D534_NEOFI|nr:conserved hypothetical protein [Aspergillus fischeri NRRL 181]EAW23527.1 conserved hypothetical protein [Aspergillus fischeri NRRL 181]KAG2027692.1 hypothetical protein GB937_000132 [Aspergillus fischeri]
MAPANPDETVQFLLSCIRYSNSGKVDFNEVAKACNIVSRGAAAKRYECLLKAYNEAANTGTTTTESELNTAAASPDSSPKKPKPANAGPPKKSKAKEAGESSNSSSPAKRKPAGESSKVRAKKARVLKESVLESAHRMIEQRLSPVKEEEVSDAEEEKAQGVDADTTAVDGKTLFDQF